ncbi:hypothetical protein FRZ61_37280 [Hypericibacter adhaerens]|jgi:hypothetical protein|uniref:Uncharacterized protein n=1 Tax=Hypericibacter adhaerens TaxID=2602016 RepID=A0A5J6N1Y3_9PROT|nr:hypothetical protein [Hypericibacter adhaerens]QEX23789.1 hypothetical protein FRZ61_37280 [Hypericibacter adhaerens]HVY52809.1 hypothetical protein [Devosia sp.]
MIVTIDPQGELRQPDLHDGTVQGLELQAGNGLRVALRDVAGQAYRLQLKGVRRLLCNDFREGNIILSLSIASRMPPDRGLLRRLLGGTKDEDRLVAEAAQAIAEGRLALVAIDPSYGCELTALCESAEIEAA